MECFLIAAIAGLESAYGMIGVIFYSDRKDLEKAQYFFERMDRIELFSPMAAYEYSRLVYEVYGDYDTALIFLSSAAEEEFEPAYELMA